MEIEENVVIEEAPEVETPRVIDRSGEPVIEFENVVKNYYLYKSGRERFKAMFTGNRGVRQHPALGGKGRRAVCTISDPAAHHQLF